MQHLPTSARHVRRTDNRGVPTHLVEVESGTLLATITQEPTLDVNSRHHQAVARLGKGLRVCARDPEDGTVEAIDLPGVNTCSPSNGTARTKLLSLKHKVESFGPSFDAVTS